MNRRIITPNRSTRLFFMGRTKAPIGKSNSTIDKKDKKEKYDKYVSSR